MQTPSAATTAWRYTTRAQMHAEHTPSPIAVPGPPAQMRRAQSAFASARPQTAPGRPSRSPPADRSPGRSWRGCVPGSRTPQKQPRLLSSALASGQPRPHLLSWPSCRAGATKPARPPLHCAVSRSVGRMQEELEGQAASLPHRHMPTRRVRARSAAQVAGAIRRANYTSSLAWHEVRATHSKGPQCRLGRPQP